MAALGAGARLHALSLNVRGLASHQKLAQLVSWALESPYDLLFTQETHFTQDPFVAASRAAGTSIQWPGPYFWCPGTGKSQGCLMLLKPSPMFQDLSKTQVAEGRLLRVDCTIHGEAYTFVCVYAPAEPAQRADFFTRALREALPPPAAGRRLLVGGDFNVILDAELDCINPAPRGGSRRQGAPELQALMEDFGLVDVWRQQRPAGHDFTHWSASAGSGARLDRWLVSGAVVDLATSSIGALPPVPSDHLPASLFLTLPGAMPRPRLPWRFPLALVNDEELNDKLRQGAQALLAAPLPSCRPGHGARTRWLLLKRMCTRLCKQHHLERSRRWRATMRAAEAQAAHARGLVVQQGVGALRAWRDGVQAGLALHSSRYGAAADAEAVLDHLYGEQSTYAFHRQAALPGAPTIITHLQVPGRGPIDAQTPEGISQAQAAFVDRFSGDASAGIFRARPVDEAARARLLAATTRCLDDRMARACEGPNGDGRFTVGELKRALRASARGKAPGLDGLPVEFYNQWWDVLAPTMCAAFNEAFDDVASPDALRDLLWGLILLIYKGLPKPPEELPSYRPITLLDVDIKILAKALADRLHVPLDFLIDATQTAFIQGRDIGDNVLYHRALAAHLAATEHPLYLMLTDLAGAYDAVDWGLLQACLRRFGFREAGTVRWAALLHQGVRLRILVNGHPSPAFPMRSGLLQGSGVSPLLWCVVLQPLTSYLNSMAAQGQLHPPVLPASALHGGGVAPAPASNAFADDMASACGQQGEEAATVDADGPAVVQAFGLFEAAGGPSLSATKSVLFASGPPPPTTAEVAGVLRHTPTGFRALREGEAERLLGVPFLPASYEQERALAFGGQPGAVQGAALRWQSRALTLVGRVHVANQCLASKLTYQASFLPPLPSDADALSRTITRFVARTTRPEEETMGGGLRPGLLACMLPKEEGGLGFRVLDLHCLALAAKPIARLFCHGERIWQPLMQAQLAAADLAAGGPGVSTWAITDPVGRLPVAERVGLSPCLCDYVRAFSQLHPCRAKPPENQSLYSVLAEPLYHNPMVLLAGEPLRSTAAFASPAGQRWRHLRDVRATALQPGGPSQEERADLQLVTLACQPPAWRAALTAAALGPCAWQLASPGRDAHYARREADPGTVFSLNQQGLILQQWPLEQDLPAVLAWQPAAVIPQAKPLWRYTEEEHALAEAAKAAGELYEPPPEEWVLGPWATIPLDPTVWGFGQPAQSLLHFEVRAAYQHLVHHRRQLKDPAFTPGMGLRPPLWGPWLAAPGDAAGPSASQAAQCPVQRREAHWLAAVQQRPRLRALQAAEAAAQRGEIYELGAPWLDLQRVRPPRVHPLERAAARRTAVAAATELSGAGDQGQGVGRGPGAGAAAAAPGHDPTSYRAVWQRLLGRSLARAHRVVAYRLLHAAVLVNAYRVYMNTKLPACDACCTHPACQRAQAPETLTHAFLECPSIAPAVAWLLDTWHHLTQQRAPRDPRVLLGDDQSAWQPRGPAGPRGGAGMWPRLWTHLRVTFLGTLWHCRCHREMLDSDGTSLAAAVVQRTVAAVNAALRRDWLRATRDVRALSPRWPADYFRGRDPRLKWEQFEAAWGPAGTLWEEAVIGGRTQLVPRLTLQWPVAAPPGGARLAPSG
jgi:exonuclease III